jgi:biopolymer transport protein ExbD
MKLRKTGAVMRQDAGDAVAQPAAYRQDDNGQPAQPSVVLVKFDGKEYVQGSPTHVNVLETKLDAAEAKVKAVEIEVGTLKAKLDAAEVAAKAAVPDVSKLVADELAFRDSMRAILPKDYKFDGKSALQVRLDAVGADVAAKVQALPEGQREGYLQCAIDAKVAAADKPTHAPAVVVKADAASTKYDPYAKLKAAHAASYNGGAK